jgi:hypothetical protein
MALSPAACVRTHAPSALLLHTLRIPLPRTLNTRWAILLLCTPNTMLLNALSALLLHTLSTPLLHPR